jgi:hypothetical protein
MRKYFTSAILILLIAFSASTQTNELRLETLNLTKGKWEFHVHDTILEPFTSGDFQGTYKFKKSGKLVVKDISFISYGKEYKIQHGIWSLKGEVLTIDMDDFQNSNPFPKSIKITAINTETFYSPQQDYKTFYWIFKRKST